MVCHFNWWPEGPKSISMQKSIEALAFLYNRDLTRLYDEIDAYVQESDLWKIEGNILNTAGNLCLHLLGNLNHFVGHVLGKTDYIRQRTSEFSDKNVSQKELLKRISETRHTVENVLSKLDSTILEEEFPVQVFAEPYTNLQMLIHLQGHLNYHLGQINYHRRILKA